MISHMYKEYSWLQKSKKATFPFYTISFCLKSYQCHKRSLLLLKPSDLIRTLTYVLIDIFCPCFKEILRLNFFSSYFKLN